MSRPVQTSIAILLVASLLITGGLSCISSSRAEGSNSELVPEPWVHETHEFNVPIDTSVPDSGVCNEKWSIEVRHGDVLTLLMARNITQDDQSTVDYTFNIMYTIGDTEYIAQFMIMYVTLVVDQQIITVPLTTCDDFALVVSPVQYNGTVPTFDCAITYKDLRLYSDVSKNSTLDLTLFHHFSADWNQTDVKVEALFDFNNTKLFDESTGNELDAGTTFATEIHYGMMVHKAHAFGTEGPIIPTGNTDGTLEYNLTLDNGAPLRMSKLNMSNAFNVFNGTGAYASMGYSSMNYAAQSHVVHGFPNLIYKDTLSMKSDPEITVFHDRVTEDQMNDNNNPSGLPLWIPIMVIGAIAAVSVAIVMVKRKKKV